LYFRKIFLRFLKVSAGKLVFLQGKTIASLWGIVSVFGTLTIIAVVSNLRNHQSVSKKMLLQNFKPCSSKFYQAEQRFSV